MTYSPSTRDRYRLAVSAVTGVTLVGALTSTGWLAGQAAQAHAADLARQQAAAQQQDKVRTARAERARKRYDALVSRSGADTRRSALRQRPTRTRVTTRYVTASEAASTTIGGGGSVSPPSATPAAPSAAAPAPAAPAAQPAPPPPPPPPPPPAPSGGSTP